MISGIVLAGGASRRFGGNKLAERIDGSSLLELATRSVLGLVDEIVVVVAPGRPLPELDPGGDVGGARPSLRFVPDPAPFEGPLAGLRTGLAAASGATVVVVGGDMPSVVPAVLALLIGRAPAALADDAGVMRPLPLALERATALAAAERLLAGGERRLRALLAELGIEALPRAAWAAEDPAGLTLLDIDERADLAGQQQGSDLAIGALREEEPGP
jgi:molybdopterin-guanine dinucleotide biosynthesis protein A